jgi:hypothetical protein
MQLGYAFTNTPPAVMAEVDPTNAITQVTQTSELEAMPVESATCPL